ncbi:MULTISPECIES: hypothetical protein [unclassified Corallococcus]|uniref:hypothetical protein n=1 Tax=unclassified Corallococcus TaxID=2685029 RepID=UPI001A8F74F5|nr:MULTISPECIES: hypothetical protein [unclassified Corallococcus]MBN9685245.1 hypothetical protein [Corallococcus sp. NCSPR001]WAS83299.1 hypothetical protein O0N60_28780 [Corallococcus sp. NCRR]
MCAERWLHGGPGLVLMVALIASGCASVPAKTRHGATLAIRSLSGITQAASSTVPGVYAGDAAPGSLHGEGVEAAPLGFRRGPLTDAVERTGTRGSGGLGGLAFACGGKAVPSGWPHLDSSREMLAPFLTCASPAEFVAMQRGVDMASLVESLEPWDAIRLGALGPLDARASEILCRKRAVFLVAATEKYGVPYAEVLALFILHSAFDDEVREVVRLLARDKQLGETLGSMAAVREELKRRELALEDFPERGDQAPDVLRGLGRAGRDMLSSTTVSGEARYADLMAMRRQLPSPYQVAFDEVQKDLMARHYSAGSISAGVFDHLTFGVPLGFYHLVAGTGHGAYSLAQGKYEQASRELAPAALTVALYAGGRGARALVEARGGPRRIQMPALDLEGMKALLGRLEEQLGVNAARDLLRYLQASREGARVAAEWGEAGLLALYESRGNPVKAQAVLAEAHRDSARAASTKGVAGKRAGGSASLAQDAAASALEAAKAKLLQAELEAPGARLPKDVELLKGLAPERDAPPAGVERGAGLWRDYVSYRERRLQEILRGAEVKGPLKWAGYQEMFAQYSRGWAFERAMVALLEADAALPRAQRRWLGDFEQPRIETHVGVMKSDLRFADVLVIEERSAPGRSPRVETFSFKSRDLSRFGFDALKAQMIDDASAAMKYYGETLRIRRPGIEQTTQVQRVRLIYEGGHLKPADPKALRAALRESQNEVDGVEVSFR